MRSISLKLPDEILDELASQAKARRVTKSWLVRESLVKALLPASLPESMSCYELARDLAGKMKSLPEDLAHDPRYMEGFGR